MYKIAVIGAHESIYGFAALGLETYPVQDEDEGRKVLKEVADRDYAVIYITEEMAAKLTDEIDKYRERYLPAIIQIPGVMGNTGAGIKNVKKSVEQAVGADILWRGGI
ncbi:V-type ATP synthase subunit F [Blautia liquoris]|uniref:V-type ATP synthase subunit F n=1 Tax=Blautia liquoris TaxID=2779518 RepID=A0A7M2RIZ5_9FIRM|nr:V-type ATP synthase subunit F [Blautia liquoris]QOV20275.1 V-type ATP synthase subunit F [Blautia liquoris]